MSTRRALDVATATPAPSTLARRYEADIDTSARSSAERQPQYFVIQFAILLAAFALLAVFSRQMRCAALKGSVGASRKIVLPALEPILALLCAVSVLFTAASIAVLVNQGSSSADASPMVNEIAYSGKQFVLVLVLAHTAQRHFSTQTMRSCVLLALVLSCYSIPVVWCLNSASDPPFQSTWMFFWALAATRALVMLFYAKIAIRPPSSRASESVLREYCAFAMMSHTLTLSVDAISHSGEVTSADALAYANLALTSLCPLFVWRVLRADTEHWRTAGSRTCELHNKLLVELKAHSIRISRVQFLQERISPQGLHLRIEMQQKLVLDFGSLEIKRRLAPSSAKQGANGARVFSGVLQSHTAVAVKVYTPADFSGETLARFAHEAALSGALHHPNIVRFYGMCISPPSVSLATELCATTLEDALHAMAENLVSYTRPTKYHFLVQLGYILDATRAVAYLHSFSPAFLHRELRPAKFVVDHEGNAKLTDLGEAKSLPARQCYRSSDVSGMEGGFSMIKSPRSAFAAVSSPECPPVVGLSDIGNLQYVPPEVLVSGDAPNEEAVDVFALAMIMWDVLHPDCERFPGLRSGDTISVTQAVTGGYRPKIALHVHPYLRQLIESSWEQDARLRPSTQYIVSVLETIQEEVMSDLAEELSSDLDAQFFGEEAVHHLTRSGRVRDKPQAIRLGNALMDAGMLHHVNHSKGFEVSKYGVYYIEETSLAQHRGRQARCVSSVARAAGETSTSLSRSAVTPATTVATATTNRPRQLTIDSNNSSASSPPATKRVHRVESFEPDQLRLIDSTLCACRRLGQHMEEPAKLVRRTRRPTPRLLEEENSLTADLLFDAHAVSSA